MTKYEKFMKLMHDRGHVKAMNVAVNITPMMDAFPAELKQAVLKSCVASSITTILKVDPEIKEAFDQAACNMMLDQVFKDLDLKQDKDFKPSEQDLLAKSIAEAFVTQFFKK